MLNKIKTYTNSLLKFSLGLLMLSIVSVVYAQPLVENEVENPDVVFAEIGEDPNVLFILDLSGSMGRNYGGSQIGNWDNRDIRAQCDSTPDSPRDVFCAENQANLSVCAIQNCTNDGHRCETDEQLAAQEQCILDLLGLNSTADQIPGAPDGSITGDGTESIECIYNSICGNANNICGDGRASCGSADERNEAAYAMEAAALRMQCSPFAEDNESTDELGTPGECLNDGNPTCDTGFDIDQWEDCIENEQDIRTFLQDQNCTGGTDACRGTPRFGSSRLDISLNVILSFLDASTSGDDSLEEAVCDEGTDDLWDNGSSTEVTCEEFFNTPFRDVSDLVALDSGNDPNDLPTTAGQKLREILTNEDGEDLPFRFLPMSYAGEDEATSCSSSGNDPTFNQSAFRTPNDTLNFTGGDADSLRRVWDFFREKRASGGTPLAHILGFDDTIDNGLSDSSNNVENDALKVFNQGFNNDDSVPCRPQFAIVITDGDDSCAGDCNDDSSSCNGSAAASSNANRRSSIQAVSNLRTKFSRSPVSFTPPNQTTSTDVEKEVITFVIGLGINDPETRRALNAMALAGGTHTEGVIRHCPPGTSTNCLPSDMVGTVNVDPVDCANNPPIEDGGSALCFDTTQGETADTHQLFREIAKAEVGSNAANVHLQGCLDPDINGICTFGGTATENEVFGNDFFTDGTNPAVGDELDGFAFLVNSPEELLAALNSIEESISSETAVGVAPAAPQSSINVSASDRIFLSLLRPIDDEKLWQGRMTLYGFVNSQDPDNPGTRTIIADPEKKSVSTFGEGPSVIAGLSIFDNNGAFDEDAQLFYWDAGRILAEEGDLNLRRVMTVDPLDLTPTNSSAPEEGFRYLGDMKAFCCENCENTCDTGEVGLTVADLGIVDSDLDQFRQAPETLPPNFCDDDNTDANDVDNDYRDCTSDCARDLVGDLIDPDACEDCSKECLRDAVVDYMSGNTNIPTIEDEIGIPVQGSSSVQSTSETSIGFNCPGNREDFPPDFDLSNCSIRFGDIFHSVPVLVGSPSPFFFDTGFQNFAINFLSRPAAAYVGANDGFLHAFHAGNLVEPESINPFTLVESPLPFFNEGSGREAFAFAPPTFLEDSEDPPSLLTSEDFRFGNFKDFVLENGFQRAFFDGSTSIGDLWLDGFSNGISTAETPDGEIAEDGSEWHTVLVAGFRNGGGGFTALDVTNFGCGNTEPPVDPADPELDFTTVNDLDCDNLESGSSDLTFMDNNGPKYPQHLWTLFDQHFGNTWSDPSFGRLRLEVGSGESAQTVDRWVMFVGGGIDPVDTNPRDGVSFGNAFYVIDVATGKIIYKFHPSGNLANDDSMVCEMASRINTQDFNNDGYIDVAYGGDTCGRLWRFDVSTPLETSGSIGQTGVDGNAVITAPSTWDGRIAFCTGVGCKVSDTEAQVPVAPNDIQPIYFPPTIAIDGLGRRHVIFQTGSTRDILGLLNFEDAGTPGDASDDFETNNFGKLYNFIDDFIPAFLAGGSSTGGLLRSEDELSSQVISLTIAGSGGFNDTDAQFEIGGDTSSFDADQGEFIVEFPNNESTLRGEKGIGTPVVINRILIFTTFAPFVGVANPCEPADGQGRIFGLDFVTGEPAFARIPGSTVFLGDDASANATVAGVSAGSGVPTVPQLTFGKNSVIATIALSGQDGVSIRVFNAGDFPSRTQTLFWEEIL